MGLPGNRGQTTSIYANQSDEKEGRLNSAEKRGVVTKGKRARLSRKKKTSREESEDQQKGREKKGIKLNYTKKKEKKKKDWRCLSGNFSRKLHAKGKKKGSVNCRLKKTMPRNIYKTPKHRPDRLGFIRGGWHEPKKGRGGGTGERSR